MYSFIIGTGNGFRFIHEVLLRRPWWKNLLEDFDGKVAGQDNDSKLRKLKRSKSMDLLLKAQEQPFHLCWRPLLQVRGGKTLHSLPAPSNHAQLVNHFSNVRSLGTKTGIARALAASFAQPLETGESEKRHHNCNSDGLDPSSRFEDVERKCIVAAAAAEAIEEAEREDTRELEIAEATPRQTLGTKSITVDVPFVPTTYIVTSAHGDEQLVQMSNMFQTIFEANRSAQHRGAIDAEEACERMPPYHTRRNMWLFKPASQNCGQGIRVMSKLSMMKRFIKEKKASEEWIVQKYIERPMLVHGRKFDIRIWVLVTENSDVFVYKEGYIRTASVPFTLDLKGRTSSSNQMQDNFVHLTNYCMQRKCPAVGKYEDGNTLSYDYFQNYLDSQFNVRATEKGFDPVSLRNDILPIIYEIIKHTVAATWANFDSEKTRKNFELFGFDFMLDANLRPWLLEVNSNPFLNKQNDFQEVLLKKAMEDLFRLAVDPLFAGSPEQMSKCRSDADTYLDGLMPENDLTSLKDVSSNGFVFLGNLADIPSVSSRSQQAWERMLSPRGQSFYSYFQDMDGDSDPKALKRVRIKALVGKDNSASTRGSNGCTQEVVPQKPSQNEHSPTRKSTSRKKVDEGRLSPKLKHLKEKNARGSRVVVKKKSVQSKRKGEPSSPSSQTGTGMRRSSSICSSSSSTSSSLPLSRLGLDSGSALGPAQGSVSDSGSRCSTSTRSSSRDSASPPTVCGDGLSQKTYRQLRPIPRRVQPSQETILSIQQKGQKKPHKRGPRGPATKKNSIGDGGHESFEIRKRGMERCALLQQRIKVARRKTDAKRKLRRQEKERLEARAAEDRIECLTRKTEEKKLELWRSWQRREKTRLAQNEKRMQELELEKQRAAERKRERTERAKLSVLKWEERKKREYLEKRKQQEEEEQEEDRKREEWLEMRKQVVTEKWKRSMRRRSKVNRKREKACAQVQ